MVVSTNPSDPLIVVIGITGQQGGSVARALLHSEKRYRMIGLSRDISKLSAKSWTEQGVQMKQVDVGVGNEDKVKEVFTGADFVFAVTNFGEHGSKDREISEGKLLADAALEAQVKLFVWSSLSPIAELTQNRLSSCAFFDTKAAVTKYIESIGLPFANVPCGLFWTGLVEGPHKPKLQEDGTYLFRLPSSPSSKLPLLDPVKDYGSYVREAIENPLLGAGSKLLTGKEVTIQEIVDGLSKKTGKKVVAKEVSKDEFLSDVLVGVPLGFAEMLHDMFAFCGELGYFGDEDIVASQSQVGIKPRTWEELLDSYEGALLTG